MSEIKERSVGLDLGTKTIGVAVSDPLGWTAQPLVTIERKSLKKDLEALNQVLVQYDCRRIILGLPLNMNGSDSEQTKKVYDFEKKLKEFFPEKEIILWDERLSTAAVERTLIDADMSRQKRKEVVNHLAASFILQGYMDSQTHVTDGKSLSYDEWLMQNDVDYSDDGDPEDK